MRQLAALVVCIGLTAPSVARTEEPRKGVTGRAAVYSRTVTAVITAPGGKALSTPPAPGDLEVLEDGVPATVTGVEALAPPPTAPSSASAHPAPEVDVETRPVPQLLWFDLSLLRHRSVKEIASGFRKAAPRLLAQGPVQIVVADPEPRVYLPPTEEKAVLDEALSRLGSQLVGRDRLTQHRRSYIETLNLSTTTPGDPAGKNREPRPGGKETGSASFSEGLLKSFAEEEVQILTGLFGRLRTFAEASLGPPPRVLYFASDGFDMDPVAFYSERPPGSTTQIGPRVLALVKESTEALARTGWIVVPVSPGASIGAPSSEKTAESPGWTNSSFFTDARPGEFLVGRPMDSLRQIADDTGGEVVVDPDKIGGALSSLSRTFLVAYSIDRAPDGKIHRLEVKSRKRDLVVRTAPTVASGTLESGAARRGIDLLSGGAAGELPVTVTSGVPEPTEAGRVKSELTVKVRLAATRNVLSRLGSGSLRFSLVVELPGHEPVAHHETVSLPESLPDVFSLKLPLGRAKEATRVAVVVEELATGIWGAGQTSLTILVPAP